MKRIVVPAIDGITGEIIKARKDYGFFKVDISALLKHPFSSATTIVLYFLITRISKYNEINATYASISDATGISSDSVRVAISQLLDTNFMKRTGKTSYFLNPEIACRVSSGLRDRLSQEYKDIPTSK